MLGAWIQDICLWDCCLSIIFVVLLTFQGFQIFSKLQWEKEFPTIESTPRLITLEGDQESQDKEEMVIDIMNFEAKNRNYLQEMGKRLEDLYALLERTKIDFEQELGNLSEPQHSKDSPVLLFQSLPDEYLRIPVLRQRVEQGCDRINAIKRNLMEIRYSPTNIDPLCDLERRITRIEQEVQKQDSEDETSL